MPAYESSRCGASLRSVARHQARRGNWRSHGDRLTPERASRAPRHVRLVIIPSGREWRTDGDARIRGKEKPAGSRASCQPLLRFAQPSRERPVQARPRDCCFRWRLLHKRPGNPALQSMMGRLRPSTVESRALWDRTAGLTVSMMDLSHRESGASVKRTLCNSLVEEQQPGPGLLLIVLNEHLDDRCRSVEQQSRSSGLRACGGSGCGRVATRHFRPKEAECRQ